MIRRPFMITANVNKVDYFYPFFRHEIHAFSLKSGIERNHADLSLLKIEMSVLHEIKLLDYSGISHLIRSPFVITANVNKVHYFYPF